MLEKKSTLVFPQHCSGYRTQLRLSAKVSVVSQADLEG